jgi:sacsin
MIPVSQLNGKETSGFAIAADLFDPSVLQLRELCFDDEEVIPKNSFFEKFRVALNGCGLKTAIDEGFVEQRVRCYAR